VPALIDESLEALQKEKRIASGDEIVIVAGEPLGESGSVNLVELRKV
jgi:pyruvate kinase